MSRAGAQVAMPRAQPRMRKPGFSTAAMHAAEKRDPVTNAHKTPIYQTADFDQALRA